MIDKLKKVLGLIGLILICAVSFFIVKTYYPEFYYHTVSLTMAGDINGLSKYISSFGYGAFAVSLGLLVFCNIFCIPTILFLTINGALFGLIPGLLVSYLGEVIGIELSFHIGRVFFRKEAREFIEQKHMLTKLDKYGSVKNMALARSIPYSPNILITALAVLSKLSIKEHLKATLIGKIPSVLIEVLLGHDLIYFSKHGDGFVLMLLLVIGICAVHRWHKKRHCDEV